VKRFRIRRSHASLCILFASLLTAQAGDLNSESEDGVASSGAAPSDEQLGSDVDAFAAPPFAAPQGGGGQSGGGSMHRIGVGVNASILLGVGIQGAVELTPQTNVRGGFNFFDYSTTVNKSGFTVDGQLHLRSAEALYDWYPFRAGFHLSPGALLYNGNKVTANLATSPGTTFTLNGATYTSGATNPTTGVGTVNLNTYKVAPMFLLGFGNLVPRKRHFSVNFDIGAAFTGTPKFAMSLAGTACSASGGCVNAAADPMVQANLLATQNKANNSISVLKALPVIRIGFGYAF
jgi:hypothetical protein